MFTSRRRSEEQINKNKMSRFGYLFVVYVQLASCFSSFSHVFHVQFSFASYYCKTSNIWKFFFNFPCSLWISKINSLKVQKKDMYNLSFKLVVHMPQWPKTHSYVISNFLMSKNSRTKVKDVNCIFLKSYLVLVNHRPFLGENC